MTVTVGLIKDRHALPVDNYIFDKIENVFDFEYMSNVIGTFLEKAIGIKTVYGSCVNQCDCTDVLMYTGSNELIVYVTGLTAVTAELIRLCALNGVSLTLMHYNHATNNYVAQRIF